MGIYDYFQAYLNNNDRISAGIIFDELMYFYMHEDSKIKNALSYDDALAKWRIKIITLLMKQYRDKISLEKLPSTILMLACKNKRLKKITARLIEQSDINYINQKSIVTKKTALIHAVDAGNIEIIKLLTEKGADIETCDSCGKNALIYAAETNDTEIIKYFVKIIKKRNIDIDKKYSSNYSLLDYALLRGNIKIINILLNGGAKFHYKDKTQTSLHLGVMSLKPKTVEHIIKYTEEEMSLSPEEYINMKNKDGISALKYIEKHLAKHIYFNEYLHFGDEYEEEYPEDIKAKTITEIINILKTYGAK